MKIIFSRKGFDSSAGGVPSPIINGKPKSIPIPANNCQSVDLYSTVGFDSSFIEAWTSKKTRRTDKCHLDPDIDYHSKKRLPDWRGAFGQCASAQSHLKNRGVGVGDIFLFFGWFSEYDPNSVRFSNSHKSAHYLFGWLQIGEILDLNTSKTEVLEKYNWLKGHPHLTGNWEEEKNNTLYVAARNLNLDGVTLDFPGYGTFSKAYQLTHKHSTTRSRWSAPTWLNPKKGGVGMTYHGEHRWSDDIVTTVGRGQEFIADILSKTDGETREALAWLKQLISDHK